MVKTSLWNDLSKILIGITERDFSMTTNTSFFGGLTNKTTPKQPLSSSNSDWTLVSAQALIEGSREYNQTIVNGDGLDEALLAMYAKQCETRFKQKILSLRQDFRIDVEASFLSAMRNWARVQAFQLLKEKTAGTRVRTDHLQYFIEELKDEISEQIRQVKKAWKEIDERKLQEDAEKAKNAANERRTEQETAFEGDHEHLLKAYSTLDQMQTNRDAVVDKGYEAARVAYQALGQHFEHNQAFVNDLAGEAIGIIRDKRAASTKVAGATLTLGLWILGGGLLIFLVLFFAVLIAFHH